MLDSVIENYWGSLRLTVLKAEASRMVLRQTLGVTPITRKLAIGSKFMTSKIIGITFTTTTANFFPIRHLQRRPRCRPEICWGRLKMAQNPTASAAPKIFRIIDTRILTMGSMKIFKRSITATRPAGIMRREELARSIVGSAKVTIPLARKLPSREIQPLGFPSKKWRIWTDWPLALGFLSVNFLVLN